MILEVDVRRAVSAAVGAAVCVVALAGCSTPVHGDASAAATPTESPTPTTQSSVPPLAEGPQPSSCLADDGCDEPDGTVLPARLTCSPLPAAMSAFDAQARAAFPDGQVSTNGSNASMEALSGVVDDVVDGCGYQVMVDIANQYPNPLYSWLQIAAVSALGEISTLDEGLRCADLAGMGFGPKDAVDYWFLWGSPDLMDADLNGTPCETVWVNVAQYMPSHY
jgi:hypothetical protein